MKTQKLLHTARVKQTLEHVTKSDKLRGNGKRMRARKAIDTYGSGARTRPRHHLPIYLANIGEVVHRSEVKEGVVWWWGKGGAYFGVLAQAFLRGNVLLG